MYQFGMVSKIACEVKRNQQQHEEGAEQYVKYTTICKERCGLNIHTHFLLVAVVLEEEI